MLKRVFCEKSSCSTMTYKPFKFIEFLENNVIKTSGLYKYLDLFKKISGENFSVKFML